MLKNYIAAKLRWMIQYKKTLASYTTSKTCMAYSEHKKENNFMF